MKQTARVISLLLNPFIMPLLGVIFLLRVHGLYSIIYTEKFAYTLILLALILTLFFPFISIYILYRSGIVSDLVLSKREERITPAIITVLYYLGFYYFLRNIEGLDSVIFSGFLGGCIALILSIAITTRWKISLHAQGISSLTGLCVGVCQVTFVSHTTFIVFLLVAIGLVGSSRLILKKHNPLQVYVGATLGFLFPYLFVINDWWV